MVLASSVSTADAPRVSLTRADLALALQRFEGAFLSHRPEGQGLIDANLAFEEITQSFFRANFPSAIRKLNETSLMMARGKGPEGAEVWLASLGARVTPAVVVRGSSARVQLFPLYPIDSDPSSSLEMRLYRGDETRAIPVEIDDGGTGQATVTTMGNESPGIWTIRVALPGGVEIDTGRRLVVVERDLAAVRDANAARLEKIVDSAVSASSLASVKARNELFKMEPNEGRSTEFLADYPALVKEVDQEIAALEAGKDPFQGRRGDYWRQVVHGTTKIPLRVYVPATLSVDEKVPLVVALHGAGGDENMFMDAYGLGAIKREADRRGFIVVSPATFFFVTKSDNLKPVIDELAACYPIDRSRVFVLGHSMGGGATARLASEKPDLIRAASCIAGFRGYGSATKVAPTLVLAAELDAIIPKAGIEEGAKKSIADGLPVEYEAIPHYGHTLVVEAQLPRVIDWLLAK
jgi:pimeloyl-ACP methyl ester carboxylesterase